MKKNKNNLIKKIYDFFYKILSFYKKNKKKDDIYPMW